MSKAAKYIIGGALGLWLLTAVLKTSVAAAAIEEKLAIMVGFPKVNLARISLKNQTIPLEFSNVRIINQSPFGAIIDNLYLNVQYFSKSQAKWINWIMQHRATNAFTVLANNTTQVPPIELMIPLTSDFVAGVYNSDIGNTIKVVASFDFYGVPVSIEDETDISSVISMVKRFNWVVG